jgi:glycosyltransferase involved in cell wall biosynthesis
MLSLWLTLVAPLLEASRPSAIVDFGADEAFSARLEEAVREHGGSVHRGGEELAGVTAPQLAFVHGEPNWHAVSERLDRLAAMARAGSAPLALTLVHGVDWPTGRRDAYPNPAAVPIGARQPHGTEGDVERALDAHDLRNGVMTAVEDFLADAADELELLHVPGFGGTAILVPQQRIENDGSALSRLVDGWRLGPQAQAQIAAIEAERVGAAETIAELRAQLAAARAGEVVLTTAEAESRREHLERLADRVAELSEALSRRDARLATLTAATAKDSAAAAPANMPPEPPQAEALGGFSQPLPLDRRRILLGEDEEPPASGPPPLHAIVRAHGDAGDLRRCIWSLLARGERPLRLTLAVDPSCGEEVRDLVRAVAAAEPRVRLVEGEPEEDPAEWRLRVEEPVEFAHGAIRNLLAAAEATPSPIAACSPQALGLPPWAGPSCLALLLAGETLAEAGLRFAAPCVALAPGVEAGPAAAVALDAPASAGGRDGGDPELGPLAWLGAAWEDEPALAATLNERLRDPLAIAYVLPGLPAEGSGGSHSIFQEALALTACGARARVLVEAEFAARAQLLYPEASELVEPYSSVRELGGKLAGFDVAVATEAPSARLVAEHVRGRDDVVGAYYIQDYEPLFSPAAGPSADAALLSYRYAEALLVFAKTHWLGNVVAAAHDVPVAKVSASLDHDVFNNAGRRKGSAPVRIVAMVRPRTPRRRAAETLAALARLQDELGDRVECLSFGCTTEELESLPPAAGVDHLGVLSRTDVAEVLRRSDLFLDLSAYQAFGRTGLEAMACGAVPVLPRAGGVVEYAVEDWNGLLVDTADEDAVLAAARALVEDPARIERLRANGQGTVRRFSATRAAASQYACFAARRQALREAA